MFGFGEKRFIGVDIGTSNIKIVELKINNNRPVLSNYAWMSLASLEKNKDPKSAYFDFILPEYLKKMIHEARFNSNQAYISVPSSGGLVTIVEFPNIDKKDLDQAVLFEAKKYIPMSLDDVVLSWDVIKGETSQRMSGNKDAIKQFAKIDEKDNKEVPDEKIEVLLVAAPKNKIEKYEQLVSDAGLKVKLIEIESFSIVRSLIGDDQGNFIIVDIGSRICNIILVEKGIIKVNRNLDAGGGDITKIIARSMNIDIERAEKLKISEKNFFSDESNMKFPVIDLIINEVSRMINIYYKNTSKNPIDAIILSGGSARFSGLSEYFSKSLNIKTSIGNSLSRIECDKRLDLKKIEMGSFFSVAIGLALSGVDGIIKE